MTRTLMVMWMALVPFAMSAAAQDADAPGAQSTVQPTPSTQPRQPPPPPPPPETERPRRRGSMVGYIEEAVVSSKVRLRFDVGWEITAPDRAEFFYAKCGCYRDLTGRPEFDPEAPGPRPGAVNDLNYQQLYVLGEYAVGDRVSAYAEMPFRWLQPQSSLPDTGGPFSNQSGTADLRAGVKLALLTDDANVVTARVQAFMPTGKAENGLGTDHWSLEPALLLHNRLSDRVAIESQIGWWHPFDGAAGVPISSDDRFAGDVFFYGVGPSVEVYRGDRLRFAPVVELVGWRVVNGFQTAATSDASGINIVNLKIGARTSWDPGSSIYVGFGKALTDDVWYDEILRFEYRVSF